MGLLRPATPLLAPSLLASALLGSTPLLAPPVLGSPLLLWPAPPILAPSLLAPPLLVRVIVGAPNENGGSAAVCITAPGTFAGVQERRHTRHRRYTGASG